MVVSLTSYGLKNTPFVNSMLKTVEMKTRLRDGRESTLLK